MRNLAGFSYWYFRLQASSFPQELCQVKDIIAVFGFDLSWLRSWRPLANHKTSALKTVFISRTWPSQLLSCLEILTEWKPMWLFKEEKNYPENNSFQWRIYIVKFWTWTHWSNFLHSHAVFEKFWSNNKLVSSLWVGAPVCEILDLPQILRSIQNPSPEIINLTTSQRYIFPFNVNLLPD